MRRGPTLADYLANPDAFPEIARAGSTMPRGRRLPQREAPGDQAMRSRTGAPAPTRYERAPPALPAGAPEWVRALPRVQTNPPVRTPRLPAPERGGGTVPGLSDYASGARHVGGYIFDALRDGRPMDDYSPTGSRPMAAGLMSPMRLSPGGVGVTHYGSMAEAQLADAATGAPPLASSALEAAPPPLGNLPRFASNVPLGVRGGQTLVAEGPSGEANRRVHAVNLPPIPTGPSFADREAQAWREAIARAQAQQEPSPRLIFDRAFAGMFGPPRSSGNRTARR